MAAPGIRTASRQNDKTATEAIAKDTDTAIERVQEIYEQELSLLATDAKITQFLGVLATRRVKMMLRKH
jgi:DNA-directed RNA polymerase specialized sigma subunit